MQIPTLEELAAIAAEVRLACQGEMQRLQTTPMYDASAACERGRAVAMVASEVVDALELEAKIRYWIDNPQLPRS